MKTVSVCALEVAEEDRLVLSRVEGVGVGEGMRHHLDLMAAEAPVDAAAEGELEAGQRRHHDRVAVPGVELGIGDQPVGVLALERIVRSQAMASGSR